MATTKHEVIFTYDICGEFDQVLRTVELRAEVELDESGDPVGDLELLDRAVWEDALGYECAAPSGNPLWGGAEEAACEAAYQQWRQRNAHKIEGRELGGDWRRLPFPGGPVAIAAESPQVSTTLPADVREALESTRRCLADALRWAPESTARTMAHTRQAAAHLETLAGLLAGVKAKVA